MIETEGSKNGNASDEGDPNFVGSGKVVETRRASGSGKGVKVVKTHRTSGSGKESDIHRALQSHIQQIAETFTRQAKAGDETNLFQGLEDNAQGVARPQAPALRNTIEKGKLRGDLVRGLEDHALDVLTLLVVQAADLHQRAVKERSNKQAAALIAAQIQTATALNTVQEGVAHGDAADLLRAFEYRTQAVTAALAMAEIVMDEHHDVLAALARE